MGLLKKKSTNNVEAEVNPTRLAIMNDEELFVFVEGSMMEASYLLAKYRSSSTEDKRALVEWIRGHLNGALLGTEEFAYRVSK